MASQPDELEREILLSRARLRRDVDDLVARVSPTAIAHRQVNRLRPAAERARAQLGRTPVLTGIGVGVATALTAGAVLVRRSKR
ncbi:MAG TPA: DUF3618 domain-containing protein [Cryptosporangiaceae bacterium]|nr:DUF3618 domain-containing protein [Cryptosporangiaceae bacterium]